MATVNAIERTLARAIRQGYNVKYVSQPAIGKTTEIERLGKRWIEEGKINFFSVLNGPAISPIDTQATMPDLEKGILRRFHDGALPNHYETPDAVGFIYLGEGEQMGAEAQRPWQKLCNHEDFGDYTHPMRLPKNVIVCTDGNLITDKSNVQTQGRAFASRFLTIPLSFDTQAALDYAMGRFHPKIGSFLKRNPNCIDNYHEVFNPKREENDRMKHEGKHGIWASMRSWNRLSDMFFDAEQTGEQLIQEELEVVGSGMAATFSEHLMLLDNLASIEEVVHQPKKAKVPDDNAGCWALSYMLSLSVDRHTFKPISVYMHRLSAEFQIAFMLTMNDRFNDLQKKAPKGVQVTDGGAIRTSPEYLAWSAEEGISNLLLSQLRG
jgi:hypothetical protein